MLNPDLIRSLTPLFLAVLGVGMMVFGMTSRVQGDKFSLASNFASMLVGGAAGSTQSGRYRDRDTNLGSRGDDT